MGGLVDGWKDGWMDGWMEGRMDGWMDGWMVDKIKSSYVELCYRRVGMMLK